MSQQLMKRQRQSKSKPIEPEIVEEGGNPGQAMQRTVNLNLHTSLKYQRLLEMPAEDALKVMDSQIRSQILLMNEQILKWTEILDGSPDWKVRTEAGEHIVRLTACITKIAEARQDVLRSTGIELNTLIPPDKRPGAAADSLREMTEDEFMSFYKEEADKKKLPASAGKPVEA